MLLAPFCRQIFLSLEKEVGEQKEKLTNPGGGDGGVGSGGVVLSHFCLNQEKETVATQK